MNAPLQGVRSEYVICTVSYNRQLSGTATHACPADSMVAVCGVQTRECTWQTTAERVPSCRRCAVILAGRQRQAKQ